MKRKIIIGIGTIAAAGVFLGSGFWWGVHVGSRIPHTIVVKGVSHLDASSTSADFGTFWQAWDVIDQRYLRASQVDNQERVYGAIAGLVHSLGDPYSEFFKPEDSQKFQQDIQGNFGGVGIELGVRRGQLTVVAPLKNTPAAKAGVQPGDAIVRINGTSTQEMAIDEAVQRIRGPQNTTVTLTLFREGWKETRDFALVRQTITTPTLDFEMKPGKIAYIQLHSFNANVNNLFSQAAQQAVSAGAKGMVLDLRNNPGGYLDVAVDLAGWFLPRGTLVVSENDRSGTIEQLKAQGNETLVHMPLVVLVNKGSASASEILAGALHDNRGVQLIGQQTFGKGTVQQIEDLRDGSSMKVTIAHWVLPNGLILEGAGLKPDVEVVPTEKDIDAQKDVQLQKALEVVAHIHNTP